MSNLAEKLHKGVKTTLDDFENRRQALAQKIDNWVAENVPNTVQAPIRQADNLSVESIRQAANAASEELVGIVKTKWSVLRGGKGETTPAATQTAAKKPAAKKPAAKKPAAKKPAAKKPAAKKPTTSK